MRIPTDKPKRFAIAIHPSLPKSSAKAEEIASFVRAQGVEVVVSALLNDESLHGNIQAGNVDILIAIGGDGTMLRAGHLCAPAGVPILGINMGRFGFLTELENENWRQPILHVLKNKYWIEERMMLRAQHRRADELLTTWDVLNEVVVCRGQFVRPIQLEATVDGYMLATYVADGLIASTPTGSTAYALAVGGPIMPPELRNILVIPVAPHLSVDRAIILAEGACVEIAAYTDHQAVLSADGQTPDIMLNGDFVRVEAGNDTVSFVRFEDPGYFYTNLTKYMEQNPTAGNNS